MALLSSFELLVQRLIPTAIADRVLGSNFPNPVSVQAYFLVLSNPTSIDSKITLTFTSNPNEDGVSDLTGGGVVPDGSQKFNPVSAFNDFTNPTPLVGFKIIDRSSAKVTFSIAPLGTGTFLLQPDISPLKDFDETTDEFSYAARGFVEINGTPGTSILASPQIRGTYFDLGKKGELLAPAILLPEAQSFTAEEDTKKLGFGAYAQQSYSLPTPGNALYHF